MIVKEFEAAGYTVVYKLLNASDYGIPQKRERVIIVGFRDKKDAYNFAYPQKIKPSEKKVLKDVIIESENNNEKLFFSERAVAGMMAVREKMNKGRVMSLDEPCNTISAHLAKVSLNSTDPVFMVGERYRRFSVREAANIQSFPSTFTLGKLSQCRQYKAIGNAVPPVLMWNVIEELERAISRTKLNKNTSTRRETFERVSPHYVQLNFLDMLDEFEGGSMSMVREEEAPYGKPRAKTYTTELHEKLYIGRGEEGIDKEAFGADAIVRTDDVKLTAANLAKQVVSALNSLNDQGAKTIIVPLSILSGLRSTKKDDILAQSLVAWLKDNGEKVNKLIVVVE